MEKQQLRQLRSCLGALFVLGTLAACGGSPKPPAETEANATPWTMPAGQVGALSLDAGDNTLSNETPTSATNGYGPFEKNTSNGQATAGDGKPITLNGTVYKTGLGVHAASELVYALNGQCAGFTASVGVDDEVGSNGSVVFRVFADGSKLYDSGVMRGPDSTKSVNVNVAGKKELKLVVLDAGDGKSSDHADWADAKLTSCTATPAAAGSGLTGEYYDNADFTGSKVTRVDASINQTFGTAAPVAGIAPTTYSVRWTGQIVPKYSETYTFTTTADDGVRLMVNGQVLVNNWVNQPPTSKSGTVALKAGVKYDIRLEYYQNTGGASVKLEWQSASQAKQIIPPDRLYSGVAVPPSGPEGVIVEGNDVRSTTATVGPSGGKITLDGATVTFPADAVPQDTAFTLRSVSISLAGPMGEGLSRKYTLSGALDHFKAPIQVELPTISAGTAAAPVINELFASSGQGLRKSAIETNAATLSMYVLDWPEASSSASGVRAMATGTKSMEFADATKLLADVAVRCQSSGGLFNKYFCECPKGSVTSLLIDKRNQCYATSGSSTSAGAEVVMYTANLGNVFPCKDLRSKLCHVLAEEDIRNEISSVGPNLLSLQELLDLGACKDRSQSCDSSAVVHNDGLPTPQLNRLLGGFNYQTVCAFQTTGSPGQKYECIAYDAKLTFTGQKVGHGQSCSLDTGAFSAEFYVTNSKDKLPFWFTDVHTTTTNPDTGKAQLFTFSNKCRVAQIKAISTFVKDGKRRSIVAGDFNITTNLINDGTTTLNELASNPDTHKPRSDRLDYTWYHLLPPGTQTAFSASPIWFIGSADLDHVLTNFLTGSCHVYQDDYTFPGVSVARGGVERDHRAVVCGIQGFDTAKLTLKPTDHSEADDDAVAPVLPSATVKPYAYGVYMAYATANKNAEGATVLDSPQYIQVYLISEVVGRESVL